MSDLLTRYEEWVLSAGTRPSVLSFIVVFAVLAVVTLAGWRQWTPSLRAWFWFCLVNVAAWGYLAWAGGLDEDWRRHLRLVLIHLILPTGVWLCAALVGKFFLGWEDDDKEQRR